MPVEAIMVPAQLLRAFSVCPGFVRVCPGIIRGSSLVTLCTRVMPKASTITR